MRLSCCRFLLDNWTEVRTRQYASFSLVQHMYYSCLCTSPNGNGGSTVTHRPQNMAIILRATETVQNSAPIASKASTAVTRAIIAAAVCSIASLLLILVLLVFLCLRRVHYISALEDRNNGARNRGRYIRDDGKTLRPTWPNGPWRSSQESEEVTWVEFLRRDQLLADRRERRVFQWRQRSAVREEQHIIPRCASPQQSLNSSPNSLPTTSCTISWPPVQTPLASIVIEQLAPGRALLSELSPTRGASVYHSRFLKDQLFRDLLNPSCKLNELSL
jgi:hypothetical protein